MSCYEVDFPIDYCEECVHSKRIDNSECHWCRDTESGEPSMFETPQDFYYRLEVEE